jgi:hypothetical protein
VPLDWTILPRTWLGWVPSEGITIGVSLLAAALCGILSLRDRTPALRPLCLGSVWMTVFGPATEMNTYSVLAGVAAYLVAAPGPRPRWATAAAVAGYGLLAASVVRCALPEDWRFQVLGPQPVGALLLATSALATERKKPWG